MNKTRTLIALAGGAVIAALTLVQVGALQQDRAGVAIDADDLGGVVTGPSGPEAGVWVIAETKDTPTPLRKIVVTDDQGRYVVPDLPKGSYTIWVRGYGLVDSPKVTGAPGKTLNLTAVKAPDARAAAEYYPAAYWYSLLQPPPADQFPGTGMAGNGLPESMATQAHFLGQISNAGCLSCHQMGTKTIRELPKNMGSFKTHAEAWDRRVQSGQSGAFMSNTLSRMGRAKVLGIFADWTERVAKGEVPQAPPRPAGLERNVVVTQWDWGIDPHYFIHDVLSTDKRNPTLNAYGPVYGVPEYSSDVILAMDVKTNKTERLQAQLLDPSKQPPWSWTQDSMQPSPTWGEEAVFASRTTPHSLQMDGQGRLWVTSTVRPPDDAPAACGQGSSHPSAKLNPLPGKPERNLSMYDPKTKQWTPLNTCYNTHHVAIDFNDVLWFSGTGNYLPWFDIKVWDKTKDAFQAQGWVPFVLDTNGNGKQDAYVGPNDPVDPAKDKRINSGAYGVVPNKLDGSLWVVQASAAPGAILRVLPGPNPPSTTLTEIYELPLMNPKASVKAFGTRGIDIDRNGVVWLGTASGHMASFDRRKCKATNGPTATGQHCLEGWTFYQQPGPNFKGVTGPGSSDGNYYTFVDQFGAGGLGENVPIALGSNSDSLKAFVPGTKQHVTMRVPYPLGFLPKGMDARIDDAKAGWKGGGLWTANAGQVMWHMEGGKSQVNKLMKFQVRPNPLAK
jgi:hypothetical protein